MENKFANKLLELRLEKSLTQNQLAKKLNVSDATINRYEKGLREPNFNLLIQIARFFDVTTDYLLGLED
jgi:transcriptional regulator with XRE-family HTH domain